jgi:hypothetical protein
MSISIIPDPSPLAQDIMVAIMVACMAQAEGAKLRQSLESRPLSEVAAASIEAAAYMLADVPEPTRSQITAEGRARLTKLMVTP